MATKIIDDVLGKGFKSLEINHPDDYEGAVKSVLIFRPAKKQSNKAVLYVHGYIDYFFQTELADHFNDWGYNFYAVDLRKYGRALMPHQRPNYAREMQEYFPDIDTAIAQIKYDGNTEMLLMGHSTGGLLTPLYLQEYQGDFIKALLLNSPFFDFNMPAVAKRMMPLFRGLGKAFPNFKLNVLPQHYPQSLHKDYKGEWDFNIAWKPIVNFPLYFTWMRAIGNGHKKLQAGLDLKIPILVMHSDKSYKKTSWSEEVRISDAVLDVEHIAKYADVIGDDITKVTIADAVHDLVLSKINVRKNVYEEMHNWLIEKSLI